MSKGVRDFSVIDLKTPLSVNGKLVVVIHPLRLGLVNEIHISGYPKPLYIRGEEAVKYPLRPSKNRETVFLYEIPIADLKERLEGLDEVSGGVAND